MENKAFCTAEAVVSLLKERNLTLATAESCTGGLVSQLITAVSGASQVFELGVSVYSCRTKAEILGVSKETLEKYGAVSKQTAYEMAQRVRKIASADFGLSVTGVAGPESSEGHPAGLVYIALADANTVEVKELNIKPVDRNFVRLSAANELLNMLKNKLKEELE